MLARLLCLFFAAEIHRKSVVIIKDRSDIQKWYYFFYINDVHHCYVTSTNVISTTVSTGVCSFICTSTIYDIVASFDLYKLKKNKYNFKQQILLYNLIKIVTSSKNDTPLVTIQFTEFVIQCDTMYYNVLQCTTIYYNVLHLRQLT